MACPLPRFRHRYTASVPCIQFDTLHIDQGDVPIRHSTVSFVFGFSNLGSRSLVIKDVQADCKCLEVEKPGKPIPPGGRGKVVLTYSAQSGKERGSFHHVAVVKSNDPSYPVLPLHASGNTDARVTFSPRTINFGKIVQGHPAVAYCFVRYTGEDVGTFRLTHLRCTSAEVACDEISLQDYERSIEGLDAAVTASPTHHTRIIRLTYDPPHTSSESRSISSQLEFQTSIEDVGTITVPITGVHVPPVMAIPSVLNFGELQGRLGRKAASSVTLRSRDEHSFRVLGVNTQQNAGPFEFSLDQVKGGVTLEVTCDESVALASHKSPVNVFLRMAGREEEFYLPLIVYAWPDSKDTTRGREPNITPAAPASSHTSGVGAAQENRTLPKANAKPDVAPQSACR